MTEAGYFESNRISPTGIVAVVALHAALITAGVLAKMEVIPKEITRLITYPVNETIDPPPIPEKKPVDPVKRQAQQETKFEKIEQVVDLHPTQPADPVEFGDTVDQPVVTPIGEKTVEPPPPPPPAIEQSAKAKGDVRRLFSQDDYPAAAQRNGDSGSLRARLLIGANGRVSGCEIVESSGHSSLDQATCRILKARARFTPAKDGSGQATNDSYVTPPITWKLEGGEG